MSSNIELYDAVKETLGPEAARMLVEAIPVVSDLARRSDVDDLKMDLVAVKADVEGISAAVQDLKADSARQFAELRIDIAQFEGHLQSMRADIFKWMLTFFVPLWIGVYGTIAAVIVLFLLGR